MVVFQLYNYSKTIALMERKEIPYRAGTRRTYLRGLTSLLVANRGYSSHTNDIIEPLAAFMATPIRLDGLFNISAVASGGGPLNTF